MFSCHWCHLGFRGKRALLQECVWDVSSYLGNLLYVSQKDLLIAGDWGGAVVVYQLVEGVKLHHPEKILSSPITKNLEVLDVISKPAVGDREGNYYNNYYNSFQQCLKAQRPQFQKAMNSCLGASAQIKKTLRHEPHSSNRCVCDRLVSVSQMNQSCQ